MTIMSIEKDQKDPDNYPGIARIIVKIKSNSRVGLRPSIGSTAWCSRQSSDAEDTVLKTHQKIHGNLLLTGVAPTTTARPIAANALELTLTKAERILFDVALLGAE